MEWLGDAKHSIPLKFFQRGDMPCYCWFLLVPLPGSAFACVNCSTGLRKLTFKERIQLGKRQWTLTRVTLISMMLIKGEKLKRNLHQHSGGGGGEGQSSFHHLSLKDSTSCMGSTLLSCKIFQSAKHDLRQIVSYPSTLQFFIGQSKMSTWIIDLEAFEKYVWKLDLKNFFTRHFCRH